MSIPDRLAAAGTVRVLLGAMVGTFAVQRVVLHLRPNQNLDLFGYNIHHLFTGVVLIVLGGIPLALGHLRGGHRRLAVAVFGIGLAMALDEWVYLIVTDGSDAAYLTAASLWGAVIAVGVTCGYVLLHHRWGGPSGE